MIRLGLAIAIAIFHPCPIASPHTNQSMKIKKMSFPVVFLLILLPFHTLEFGVLADVQKTWCVAKPSSSEAELQNNINYACQVINCGAIQMGGPCYEPRQLASQASVVMNLFYQQNGRRDFTCYFSDSGLIVVSDPSYGSCSYPYY